MVQMIQSSVFSQKRVWSSLNRRDNSMKRDVESAQRRDGNTTAVTFYLDLFQKIARNQPDWVQQQQH